MSWTPIAHTSKLSFEVQAERNPFRRCPTVGLTDPRARLTARAHTVTSLRHEHSQSVLSSLIIYETSYIVFW